MLLTENLTFDGDEFRTPGINEAARLIYNLGEGFGGSEKGQCSFYTTLSSAVGKTGLPPGDSRHP